MTEENTTQKEASLEEMFDSLEKVIERMETEEISLEESFTLYQNGIQLLKKCNDTLDAVEKKVQILDETGECHDF
ncbi:MAG: exodeoxyribonuclease VII small subunit [Hespellia sp.]|jgi:exodeoxyribonuclease VII small subunit|nr:exodeoxyribonuclease VII small subunit [Hespellia sp.]